MGITTGRRVAALQICIALRLASLHAGPPATPWLAHPARALMRICHYQSDTCEKRGEDEHVPCEPQALHACVVASELAEHDPYIGYQKQKDEQIECVAATGCNHTFERAAVWLMTTVLLASSKAVPECLAWWQHISGCRRAHAITHKCVSSPCQLHCSMFVL